MGSWRSHIIYRIHRWIIFGKVYVMFLHETCFSHLVVMNYVWAIWYMGFICDVELRKPVACSLILPLQLILSHLNQSLQRFKYLCISKPSHQQYSTRWYATLSLTFCAVIWPIPYHHSTVSVKLDYCSCITKLMAQHAMETLPLTNTNRKPFQKIYSDLNVPKQTLQLLFCPISAFTEC